jgi:hypothetical protein
MTVICVAGMHRSGTSLLTRLLRNCGLDLGDEADLMQPWDGNPDGYWENLKFVEINEALLFASGGGWDHPPPQPVRWSEVPALAELLEAARKLVAGFASEPWGWKDPRNSLTLPFWQEVLPGLKVVVAVRNPLEVARSLSRRNDFSSAHSLSLWLTHYERITEAVTRDSRMLVRYEDLLDDPKTQIVRLAAFAGLDLSSEEADQASTAASSELRHHRFTDEDLGSGGVPDRVIDMYASLCTEAGAVGVTAEAGEPAAAVPALSGLVLRELLDGSERHAAALGRLETGLSDARRRQARLEAALATLARQIDELAQRGPTGATPPEAEQAVAALDYPSIVEGARAVVERAVPVGSVVAVVSRGDDTLVQFAGRTGWHFPQNDAGVYAGHYPADGAGAVAHLEALRARGARFALFPTTASWWLSHYGELRDHLAAHADLVVDDDSCQLYALHGTGPALDGPAPLANGYGMLVEHVRDLVGAVLPRGASVAVVSNGDGRLLDLDGPIGWHFPGSADGEYAGWHPADSTAAIAHLESVRQSGAEYLVIPHTSFWWLSYYAAFRQHLEAKYRRLLYQSQVCAIFDLWPGTPPNLSYGADTDV